MSIFDMFGGQPQEVKKEDPSAWSEEKRKAVGQKREDKAIKEIKSRVTYKDHVLQGLHFIEPKTGEICETDGIYVCGDTLHVIEIKSKNFDYLYGNTDTGYWYLKYQDSMVKSDNVFRQIARQIRILAANTEHHFNIEGHIFINNKSKDVTMDIIGPVPHKTTLHTDVEDLCRLLRGKEMTNFDGVKYLTDVDAINKTLIPPEWAR